MNTQIQNEKMKSCGKFHIKVVTKDGVVKQDLGWIENLVTSAGKAAFAGLVGNTGGVSAFTYLAVGTSSTAPAVGDTALGSEITMNGLARAAATISRQTTTYANDTLQLAYTWTATGSQSVAEIGIFNAASTGTMATHQLTGAISMNNTDQLVVTYQVQFI